ncbi:hypothetical protein LCGC14_3070590 [marine sediment metagenome]|uniref:HTH marR-type domain-containing protein n=1 Tax=marine sediment metagenome TaxID=412755 RepID=A0A0F8WGU4_9ZZZZ
MIEYFCKINEKRFKVLDLINNNKINQARICKQLNLATSTVERIVSSLYLMSYIEKERIKNIDMYSTTNKGKASYEILKGLYDVLLNTASQTKR